MQDASVVAAAVLKWLLQLLFQLLFCTVVALWAFGAYLLQEESIENLPCTIDNKIDWWDLFWCDDIESGRYQTSVKNAHVASEAPLGGENGRDPFNDSILRF